eukprot:SAG31_NODE_311_length_17866_cov_7.010750_1_plen_58_part_00
MSNRLDVLPAARARARIGSECGQLGQKIPLNYTGIVFLKYLEGAARAHDLAAVLWSR